MKWEIEITDTFGGEPNYSWVRRVNVELPDETPAHMEARKLLRAMRAASDAGRCLLPPGQVRSECTGDSLIFRPRGACLIAFATPAL